MRWRIAWSAAILAALNVLLAHATDPGLLQDSDTRVLLQAIRARHAPFSWFLGDWPLQNHFYRPLPTLAFELDSRLYGNNAAGYGWTNAILAAGCVLALFWLLRELTNRPLASALGALLFSAWQASDTSQLSRLIWWAAWLALFIGLVRDYKNWRTYIPASLVVMYFSHEANPIVALNGRVLDWLPGRTASCMALFGLAAMASYARFERLGPRHSSPQPATPLTPPATRSAKHLEVGRVRWPWAAIAVVLGAGAFASYEQAVMLPACLLGLAICFRWLGYKPAWGLQVAFWGLLLGYLEVRHQVIPPGVSSYQRQQLRTTHTAISSLLDFTYPIGNYSYMWDRLQEGWVLAFDDQSDFRYLALMWIAMVVTAWQLRREWMFAVTGLALSILSFLPMAWIKIFAHYYYWPMALRTIFVIALGRAAWRLASNAVRPRELQAPPRSAPAPGSLPGP